MEELDYSKAIKKTRKHKYLYHYTTKESFNILSQNNSLRLSRLDLVNDPDENGRIISLWHKKVFVVCFTNTLANQEYFWKTYGKNGVRLRFKQEDILNICENELYFDPDCKDKIAKIYRSEPTYKSDICDSDRCKNTEDWGFYDSNMLDIRYVDDIKEYSDGKGENNAGLIKAKKGYDNKDILQNWETESETRLRVALRPKSLEFYAEGMQIKYYMPNIEHIYLNISGIEYDVDYYDDWKRVGL